MEAWLHIGSSVPDVPTALEILNNAGVVHGISESELAENLSSAAENSRILAASGSASAAVENARLIYLVDFQGMEMENGESLKRVDFKETKKQILVHKDQELVSKLPSSEGEAVDVRGNKVTVQGRDVELPAGKNTYISQDGLTLRAATNGSLFMNDKKLSVDTVYSIKGNVDYSTGNISYQGSVIIDGDVRTGFKVYATDDITIRGNVDAADVFSKNGTISVENGVLGKNKAKLLAGRSIFCGFVQDASLGAKEDIIIKRYAFNSSLSAGRNITALESEGLIRGGTAIADKVIDINSAGSIQNKHTELRISDSEFFDQNSGDLNDSRSRNDLEAELSVARKRLDFLNLLEQRLGKLSVDKHAEMKGVEDKIQDLQRQIAAVESEVSTVQTAVPETSEQDKYIQIHEKCNRGVLLKIGEAQFQVDDTLVGMKVWKNGSRLELKPIKTDS